MIYLFFFNYPVYNHKMEKKQITSQDAEDWIRTHLDSIIINNERNKYYSKLGLEISKSPETQAQRLIFQNKYENQDFQINFLTKKTEKEVRNRYINKLLEIGVMKSQPSKKHQTIIIFDWDDTLMCTSFLSSFQFLELSQEAKLMVQNLDQYSHKLLEKASGCGEIFIITNAAKGWVQYSSKLYLPRTNQLLIRKKVKIISARSQFQEQFPGDFHRWKQEAFKAIKKDFNLITNLICIGDSNIQMEAAHTLGKQFVETLVKTVKFRQNPKPYELYMKKCNKSMQIQKILQFDYNENNQVAIDRYSLRQIYLQQFINKMKKGYLTILNLIILQILTKKSSRLQFDQSNLFTVLQLTDLHLGESLLQDQQTYAVIDKLIHIAKPKLIAITGDLVSNYVSQSNDFALTHLKLLDKIFEQRKIYYFFVMGNHDHFLDISEQQFISFCEDKQFCLTQQNPVGRTNFYHYIYKQQKAVYVLWGFDGTVDYPDGWGEFQADQIKYITDSFQTILQNDSKITGIGFKHVPPKQFIETEKLQNLFGYKGQAIQCSSISIIEMVNRYNILKGLLYEVQLICIDIIQFCIKINQKLIKQMKKVQNYILI